jgi:DNA-directed RNA polymerase specialized sigma24 family protein
MVECEEARAAVPEPADVASADERFRSLLSEADRGERGQEILRDFFIAEYAVYVYKVSHSVYRSRLRRALDEDDVDRVRTVAIDAIETIARAIESGELRFRGESRFSTYVFGVVKWKTREALDTDGYVPKEVRDLGSAAIELFKALAFDRLDARTAVGLVSHRTDLSEAELQRLRKRMGPAIGKWSASVGARARAARESVPAAGALDSLPSSAEAPDAQFARAALREACEEVLWRMSPRDAEAIELRFVRGRSIEELRVDLGLADAQAARNRVFRARKSFAREAKRLGMGELFKAYVDGGGA